jgi:hypothetical protein
VTADQLRQAEARYKRASSRADAMREQRNALVHEALTEGWTHAQIAEATGLSRGRVSRGAVASPAATAWRRCAPGLAGSRWGRGGRRKDNPVR